MDVRYLQVSKSFGSHEALAPLDLHVADGDFLALLGPSGCGKTTALRLLAGLERPTGGRIFIGERDVTFLPTKVRDIAMVFQSYALYPHLKVADNIAYPLRVRKVDTAERVRQVRKVAELLGLEDYLERRPAQLSGGQRQRVALGRAIVREPLAFLFDEPLSNLDAQLRVETRVELSRLHRKLGATMVYVTHDQSEALTLGDRIAVLKEGVLQQIATPMELYQRPANKFVAGFIGSPAMNFIEGVIQRSADSGRGAGMCTFKGIDLTIDVPCGGEMRGRVFLGVRPQHIEVSGDGENRPRAEVGVVEPMGNELIVYVTLSGGDRLVAVAPPQERIKPGDIVSIRIRPEGVHLFDAESGLRIDPVPQRV